MALFDAVVNGIANQKSISNNKDAADQFSSMLRGSSDILKGGYDEQLGHIEEGSDYLRDILSGQLTDTTGILRGAASDYGNEYEDNVIDYARYMFPQYDEYGNTIIASADAFTDDMNVARDQAFADMRQGAAGFEQAYDPYTGGGEEAMQYLTQVMSTNPDALTPAQRRMVEQYNRDSVARLAASGLRGSGRGGVAAVNEGDAALKAQLYDINQNRADQAAGRLAQLGYGATGAVAGNRQTLANNIADLGYKTGSTTAANKQGAVNTVSSSGYDLSKDVGNKLLTGQNSGATVNLNTENKVADNTNQYYGNLASVEGGRFQARGDTAFGKALSDSATEAAIANNSNATNITNNSIKANTYGQIADGVTTAGKILAFG